jgi:hypothetical protein
MYREHLSYCCTLHYKLMELELVDLIMQ